MKILEIQTAMMRDILLWMIVLMFVNGGIIAAFVAADRQIAAECRAQQEYRPCQ